MNAEPKSLIDECREGIASAISLGWYSTIPARLADFEALIRADEQAKCQAKHASTPIRSHFPVLPNFRCPDHACRNTEPHPGMGKGCVHYSRTGSDVPDRHDQAAKGAGH